MMITHCLVDVFFYRDFISPLKRLEHMTTRKKAYFQQQRNCQTRRGGSGGEKGMSN